MSRNDVVHDTTEVQAPLERVWKLSTRVELVRETLGMEPAGGRVSGFVRGGSRVVWRGWKFGLPTEHRTLISGFAPPHPAIARTRAPELHAERIGQLVAWFQDQQERGRFAFFQHDHWLREKIEADGRRVTVLEDEVRFRLPLGPLGRVVSRFILAPYIRGLVKRRFAKLKALAEGDGWREWMEVQRQRSSGMLV